MTNNALKILQSLFVLQSYQNLQAQKILQFWVFVKKIIVGCIKLMVSGIGGDESRHKAKVLPRTGPNA